MAYRCSARTPKGTPGTRFWPTFRPLNFYASELQSKTGTLFFTFSKLTMLHHTKSFKMHTSFHIFPFTAFTKNEKKHVFYTQSRFPKMVIYIEWKTSRSISFSTRKNTTKNISKKVSKKTQKVLKESSFWRVFWTKKTTESGKR